MCPTMKRTSYLIILMVSADPHHSIPVMIVLSGDSDWWLQAT